MHGKHFDLTYSGNFKNRTHRHREQMPETEGGVGKIGEDGQRYRLP